MKIYTGRGDEGLTDLQNMDRVSKANLRIEAYGTVDEVNALLGIARPLGHNKIDEQISEIQNHLHIVQADFANPEPDDDDPVVQESHVEQIENWIDRYDDELDPLEDFILPSGSESGSKLHHARAVCRRAERRAVALANDDESVNTTAVVYLNRLSDVLFTFGRFVNENEGIREESPRY